MTAWEYLTRTDLTEGQLSELGAQGWELVSRQYTPNAMTMGNGRTQVMQIDNAGVPHYLPLQGVAVYVFKRPLPPTTESGK